MTTSFPIPRRAPAPPARAGVAALAAVALFAGPVAGQSDTDIYLLELDRSGDRVLVTGPPTAVTDRGGYDNQPHFTADGAILYTSIRGDQADSYRFDPSTGRRQRLTRTPESEYSPTPMAGGERFSVVRVEADSTQRLWSFAMDGTGPRLVLEDVRPVGYHAWVDAERVALFVLGDPASLWVADTGTGAARAVTDRIGRALQHVPGTAAVSFTQETDDGWWIREYGMRLDTVRTLARLPGPDGYHAWLPDRTLLTAHGTEILAYDPTREEWSPIVDLADAGIGTLSRLAVSADGSRLAVVADREPEDPGFGAAEDADFDTAFSFASLVIGSLLAMVNPLGALTIFVGLTATYSARHRRFTALWACISAAAILMVFALFGTAILRFFGITTYAFRIAGGIIFFAVGWDMLQARRSRSKTTPEEEEESAARAEVAVVPLGIPTLAGPGAITTVIALMGQTSGPVEASIVYLGILVVLFISLLAFMAGPAILRLIGQTGVNVFTRLMGLLITVIGVQFVLDGIGTVVGLM